MLYITFPLLSIFDSNVSLTSRPKGFPMSSDERTWPDAIKDYTIGDELGHGSFSHVCKCKNTKTNVEYAIKIFGKENLADDGDQNRFQREIDTMAYLRHDNLIALYDFFWDERNFYLVIDLCPGGELFDYIVNHEKLDEPTAALIFQQIVSAIAYCHSFGVAHRDLKPENVLIVNFPFVKVADFGLCGFIADQQLMRTFCGSPCYCAPECLCRIQYDGRKSDIWSLGAILFAMVVGEHPWNVSNTSIMLRQILKATYTVPAFVSPGCKVLIQSMMKVNPADRITIEAILEHPWLRIAAQVPTNPGFQMPSLAIPAPAETIKDISEASARAAHTSEGGIFSPFEAGGDGTGAMPKLVQRSASFESLVSARGLDENASARRKVQGQGPSLAQSRQRSATNIEAQRRAQVGRRKSMGPIDEDDG
jgi:serine/threonine protein kinase